MKKILLCAAALCTVLPSMASTPRHKTRHLATKVTVVGSHSAEQADSVKEAFEDNAPSNRNIEGIPRFAIVGKENLFYMGVGAALKLNGAFDWGDDANSVTDFTPASFTPSTPGNRSNLGFTAKESTIYMNIVALPGRKDRFSLFFSANFKGENKSFKLSHIYAKYRGLTIGYTDDAFTDGDAVPYTIDSEGPNGSVSYKTVVAYWTQDFGQGISGILGVDAPSASMEYNDKVAEVNQRIFAIPMALQYRWGDGSHVRLSGLLRPMQYRNLVLNQNKAILGWGVQVSGLASITDKLCTYYNAAYGLGIEDYFCDAADIGADVTPSLVKPGKMYAAKAWGISAGLSYAFRPDLVAHAVYSQMRVYPHSGALPPTTDYLYGQYLAANLMYNLNRFVYVGVEYDWGKRRATNGESLHVNRLQALFQLAF